MVVYVVPMMYVSSYVITLIFVNVRVCVHARACVSVPFPNMHYCIITSHLLHLLYMALPSHCHKGPGYWAVSSFLAE